MSGWMGMKPPVPVLVTVPTTGEVVVVLDLDSWGENVQFSIIPIFWCVLTLPVYNGVWFCNHNIHDSPVSFMKSAIQLYMSKFQQH